MSDPSAVGGKLTNLRILVTCTLPHAYCLCSDNSSPIRAFQWSQVNLVPLAGLITNP